MLPALAPLEMTVPAGDGLLLKGLLVYPEGPPGRRPFPLAVLAHQYPATADSFAPLLDDLLDRGVATLAFDERGHGASTQGSTGPVVIDTPVGFAMEDFGRAFMASAARVGFNRIDDDILRVASWGASQNFIDSARILLVGASVGGTGAVLAGPRVPSLAGLLTFGAAGELVWGDDGRTRARRAVEAISAPALFATSEQDPFDAAGNGRVWAEGLTRAQAVVVPGAAHAMAIYYDTRDEVLRFLARVLGH
jgi:pimeloyl-ACP methyl ester carboxylesterase